MSRANKGTSMAAGLCLGGRMLYSKWVLIPAPLLATWLTLGKFIFLSLSFHQL